MDITRYYGKGKFFFEGKIETVPFTFKEGVKKELTVRMIKRLECKYTVQ